MNGMAEDHEIRDELPEDLDTSNFVGPYMFPNNNRRRIPAVLYGVIGLGAIAVWLASRGSDPVLVNAGLLWGGIALVLFGIYSYQAGFDLDFDERTRSRQPDEPSTFPSVTRPRSSAGVDYVAVRRGASSSTRARTRPRSVASSSSTA